MKTIGRLGLLFGVVFFLFGSVTLRAQVKVGDVRPYHAESPHPYPAGSAERPVVWEEHVISPGAKFVRVHFTGLSLAPGDYLTVSSPDRSHVDTYTEKGPQGDGDVWAFSIYGEEAVVAIHGGPSPGYGYRIEEVGHGTGQIDSTFFPRRVMFLKTWRVTRTT